MYDAMDAMEVLKKHHYDHDVEVDIKRKNIDKSVPFDMKGRNNIYCKYLSKIWSKLRDQLTELQSIDCVEWDNLPESAKERHKKCDYVCISNQYCTENCNYYQEKLKPLIEEKDIIAQMSKDLKDNGEKDFWSR